MNTRIAYLLCITCALIARPTAAQRPELHDNAAVKDSLAATIARDRAEGLWSDAIATGELKGRTVLDLVVDDKGRVESVFVKESDLSIAWKNAVKDQWYDRRLGFKLPRGHKEHVTLELHFP